MVITDTKKDELYIQSEIQNIRNLLHEKAQEYNFDLLHPEILSLSKKLDELVLLAMKKE